MLRQKQGGGNGRHAMKNAFIQKNKKKKTSEANIYVYTVCGQSASKNKHIHVCIWKLSTKAFQNPVKYTVP